MELSHKIKDNYKAIIHESQKDLYYMKEYFPHINIKLYEY